ncbi:MAG: hypothetical protein AMJ81_00315 [Phycisphaerae bacterium SM23_33]|nr:MAG: hypothetical protein AMJ81_00315 [Phycisphaerae bacterium SM23_33]
MPAVAVALTLAAGSCLGQTAQRGKPHAGAVSKAGGIEVYAKLDFDRDRPFKQTGSAKLELEGRPELALDGRSLHVSRLAPEGSFGMTLAAPVAGSKDLKIAFCIRGKGLDSISVNYWDNVKRDNTTPRTNPRLTEDLWLPVILHAEDFRYNGGSAAEPVAAQTDYTSLTFYPGESRKGEGEYWIENFVIYRGDDTAPPGPPMTLRVKPGQDGQVELTWKQPQDNAFPAVYSIYRRVSGQWRKVGETVQTRFVDTVPAVGLYSYRVTAADYENNCSRPALAAPVTVTSAGKEARITDDRVKDRLGYAENVRRIYHLGAGKNRRDVFLFFGGSHTAPWSYHRTLSGCLDRGIPVLEGRAGGDTALARSQIKQVLESARPQFAVIMFGTRDEKDAKSIAAAMRNLSYVIAACVGSGTVPVMATIPPRGHVKQEQAAQRRFNEALIRLCRKQAVPVSYCFEEMMAADLSGAFLDDGVSLSLAGNLLAGAALRKTFDQIYFAIRDTGGLMR